MALTNHILSDSPTNNFSTWNKLDTTATLSDGNLKVVTGNVKTFSNIFLPKSNGKYYAEYYVESMGYPFIGVYNHDTGTHSVFYSTTQPNESIKIKSVNTANTFTVTNGDIVSVLVDTTNETIQWFKNGGSSTSTYTLDDLSDNDYSFYMIHASGSGTSTVLINFGQDPTFGGASNLPAGAGDYDTDASGNSTGGRFAFQPPTGALALCTANLPEMTPTVDDDTPQDYFKAVTWSGTGSDQNVDLGFNADLVWAKRTNGSDSHRLYDSIRGEDRDLITNSDGSENTVGYGLGFINSNTRLEIAGNNFHGGSANTFVAWCWKAGGVPTGGFTGTEAMVDGVETTCSALASSAGASITPTAMSVNTKAGFSIIQWSGNNTAGATYSHGLSQAPELVITKCTNASVQWIAYSSAVDSTGYLSLSDAFSTSRNSWFTNNTPPSTSLISNGYQSGTHNDSAHNYITYCWHSVEGYSKFGSYIGSATSPHPFVYVGFRPALVIIKGIDNNGYNSYQSWIMFDTSRDDYNPSNSPLHANANYVEGVDGSGSGAVGGIDILSNGFRILDGSATYSGISNIRHIYMAFAEQPFIYSNAR